MRRNGTRCGRIGTPSVSGARNTWPARKQAEETRGGVPKGGRTAPRRSRCRPPSGRRDPRPARPSDRRAREGGRAVRMPSGNGLPLCWTSPSGRRRAWPTAPRRSRASYMPSARNPTAFASRREAEVQEQHRRLEAARQELEAAWAERDAERARGVSGEAARADLQRRVADAVREQRAAVGRVTQLEAELRAVREPSPGRLEGPHEPTVPASAPRRPHSGSPATWGSGSRSLPGNCRFPRRRTNACARFSPSSERPARRAAMRPSSLARNTGGKFSAVSGAEDLIRPSVGHSSGGSLLHLGQVPEAGGPIVAA